MGSEKSMPIYIDEVILALEKMMASNQSSLFGNLMKATKGETFVLKILLKSESPLSPTELSEALHSSKPRISAILRSLEKKGDIRREVDRHNRRNILVSITETGKARIMTDMNCLYDTMGELLLEMGEADTREIVRLAEKLADIMKNIKKV